MQDRRTRFIALTGVAWGVLAAVGVFTSGGETPEADSSPAKVVAYYSSHSSEVKVSAIFFAFAFLFFLLFAGVLRAFLRRNAANEPLATLAMTAAVGLAVTAGIGGGVELGLAKNIHHLEPAAAQAANLVQSEVFLPALITGFVFALCNGLAILRGSQLPRWLGWVAIVLAVAFIIPPVALVALLVLFLWSLVVSILMFLRYDSGVAQAEPAPATG
jgi:hypothetical protein